MESRTANPRFKKTSPNAELIAVAGRRRVGKTLLIGNYFQKEMIFELTGIHNASLKDQLQILA